MRENGIEITGYSTGKLIKKRTIELLLVGLVITVFLIISGIDLSDKKIAAILFSMVILTPILILLIIYLLLAKIKTVIIHHDFIEFKKRYSSKIIKFNLEDIKVVRFSSSKLGRIIKFYFVKKKFVVWNIGFGKNDWETLEKYFTDNGYTIKYF